nr:MAG TPA: ERCC4 domain protein [Caudoviricetes sp.]
MKDKDMKKVLENIIILVDSREQKWSHIKLYLKQNNISYQIKSLDFGDYSFRIPKIESLNVEEQSFEKEIAIERKNSLSEISGNFTRGRDRFKREFKRGGMSIRLMIENDSYGDIKKHNYNTKINPNSLVASLHSFQEEFNSPFIFIDKDSSGEYIYKTFYYYLRNKLKNNN